MTRAPTGGRRRRHARRWQEGQPRLRWCRVAALEAGVRLGRARHDLRMLAGFVAEAAIAAGQGSTADRLFAQAVHLADRPADRVDLLVRRARLARREMRLKAAIAHLARARRDATGKGTLSVEIESCFLALRAGREAEALERANEAVGVARRRRWFDLEWWALSIVEEISSSKEFETWVPTGEALLRAAHRSGDATLLARSCIDVALSYDNRGDWARAHDLYAQAAAEFARSGDVLLREVARCNQASIQLELGNVDTVVVSLKESIRIFAAAGAEDDVDVSSIMFGRAEARRAGASGIAARLRPRVARLVEAGSTDTADFQTLGLAEVHLLDDDIASAMVTLERLLARTADYGAGHLLPISCHRLLAMAHWRVGQTDRAASHLEAAQRMSSEQQVLPEELMVLWARAQIDGVLSPDDAEREDVLSRELPRRLGDAAEPPGQRFARVPPGPTVFVRKSQPMVVPMHCSAVRVACVAGFVAVIR